MDLLSRLVLNILPTKWAKRKQKNTIILLTSFENLHMGCSVVVNQLIISSCLKKKMGVTALSPQGLASEFF